MNVKKATRRDKSITAALNRVYSQESSALDPVLAALQSAALDREDWDSPPEAVDMESPADRPASP